MNRTLWLLVLIAAGCASSERMSAPEVQSSESVKHTNPNGEITERTRSTTARGASYEGKNAKDLSSGALGVGPRSANAGETTLEAFEPESSSSLMPIYIIGALAVVAAGALWYFSNSWKLAAGVGGAGALLLATARVLDKYPWIFAIAIILALVSGGFLAYSLWIGKRRQIALEAIVPAVESLNPGDQEIVKEEIGKTADARGVRTARVIKDTVTRTKRELAIE